MLRALVAAPSVSSHDPARDQDPSGVLTVLEAASAALGGRVQRVANPRRPRNPFLIADFGPVGVPAAVVAGHLDTVPAGDGWTGDPWTLRVEPDRLIGLGVADMKGFFAAVLAALEAGHDDWRSALRLVATTDEESGMEGIRSAADAGLLPPVPTVLGEPTDGEIGVAHKGIFGVEVVFRGRDGHASLAPESGVAARALTHFLAAVEAWRQALRERAPDLRFRPPHATCNVGVIRVGDAMNRIATPCLVQIEVRRMPGQEAAAMIKEIATLADAAAAATGTEAETRALFDLPAFANAHARQGGHTGRFLPYGTEAAWFPDGGREVHVWGPGALAEAHTADETLSRSALSRYTEEIRAWMTARCRGPA